MDPTRLARPIQIDSLRLALERAGSISKDHSPTQWSRSLLVETLRGSTTYGLLDVTSDPPGLVTVLVVGAPSQKVANAIACLSGGVATRTSSYIQLLRRGVLDGVRYQVDTAILVGDDPATILLTSARSLITLIDGLLSNDSGVFLRFADALHTLERYNRFCARMWEYGVALPQPIEIDPSIPSLSRVAEAVDTIVNLPDEIIVRFKGFDGFIIPQTT
jgi:hypothetical protein